MPSIGPFELFFLFFALAFWIVPSYLVAKYAERKGQNFLLFLLLGLATSFVVSWIIALLVSQNQGAGQTGGLTFTTASQQPRSTVDELERLGQLHRSGVLTDGEFEAQKARVLAAQG